ncbi:MAG TPA: DUF6159 family protein [Candidatus Polarisedimenticolaceae bacterium]|nr:DUF6159 family protein [Candidatus Polarisedimenticolaceae bacterium]
MNAFTRSWELVKASWSVLRDDKELMVFPVISTIAVVLVMVSFAVPMFLTGIFEGGFAEGLPVIGLALGFLFYVVQYIVIFYCNSALIGAAMIRLDGGKPTLGDGFRIASSRFGAIVGYALISATVGVLLRSIARRGFIGRLIASALGFGWNLATFLAVPILVVEGIGPVEAVKRSTELLKKTWGEQIVGNIGIGFAFGMISFFTVAAFAGVVIVAVNTHMIPLVIAAVVLGVTSLLALGLVGSTLTAIYTAAVYRYAVKGDGGAAFPAELVSGAFQAR